MSKKVTELRKTMKQSLPAGMKVSIDEAVDTIVLHVDVSGVSKLLKFLRDNAAWQCKQLVDVTAVDYPAREKRFDVVYNLLSLKKNLRLRVVVSIEDGNSVPSVCGLYSSANWLEREVFDMYGIEFTKHPDMRRILTDYGFEGHPQRKDFPLTGYKEVRYDLELKRVIYEPVSLTQDFRNFDFLSPWEGTDYVLPGDEKAAG